MDDRIFYKQSELDCLQNTTIELVNQHFFLFRLRQLPSATSASLCSVVPIFRHYVLICHLLLCEKQTKKKEINRQGRREKVSTSEKILHRQNEVKKIKKNSNNKRTQKMKLFFENLILSMSLYFKLEILKKAFVKISLSYSFH